MRMYYINMVRLGGDDEVESGRGVSHTKPGGEIYVLGPVIFLNQVD